MPPKNANADNEEPAARGAVKPAAFRTLVVDASRFMEASIEHVLAAEGRTVLTASSSKSALERTRQFQPDLIFLDGGLIDAEGIEVLGELLIEQASAAVVVVAREASVAQAVETIKMGALDYLERPLRLEKVLELVESQLEWFRRAPASAPRAKG